MWFTTNFRPSVQILWVFSFVCSVFWLKVYFLFLKWNNATSIYENVSMFSCLGFFPKVAFLMGMPNSRNFWQTNIFILLPKFSLWFSLKDAFFFLTDGGNVQKPPLTYRSEFLSDFGRRGLDFSGFIWSFLKIWF